MSLEPILSHRGRQLLDRRNFLAHAAGGLGSVALAHLLAQDHLLANEVAPIRPAIDPTAQLRAAPPTLPPALVAC